MNLSWDSILIASIPGFLALLGILYNEYRKKKNLRAETDVNKELRREPTWNELVTENRNLRTELTTVQETADEARDKAKDLRAEFDEFKRHQEKEMQVLRADQALADHRELLLYHHTNALRHHIINELPPPPPSPPKELVDWFEELEKTTRVL